MSFLLTNFLEALPMIIALVLLAVLVVIYFLRKKKYNDQMESMQSNLKVGDVIVTYSGIVGKIASIKNDQTGKYLTIQTGEGAQSGYIQIDSRSVYGPVQAAESTGANKPAMKADQSNNEKK